MVQDNELSTSKEKTNLAKLFWVGKLVVTLFIISYIYKTFQNEKKGVSDVVAVLMEVFTSPNLPALVSMLLLVPVNWSLESKKWQQLVQKVIPVSFTDAFRGTLTGLAMGVAVPAQLGDSLGRIAALRSDKRLEAIGAALVSNGIQFYVSLLGGALAWFHLNESLALPDMTKKMIGIGLAVLLLLGFVVASFRKRVIRWNPDRQSFKKIHSYLRIIGTYTSRDLLMAMAYGLARYLVFLSQFVLALSFFDFRLSLLTLSSCVALIFLAKTVIPAINVLGDLGLREFTALFVFKQYNLPAEEIITATFMVWMINVMGPILIGIVLIWKYKWRLKND